jgi:hypothetical protein
LPLYALPSCYEIVSLLSGVKLWWRCSEGHSWRTSVSSRSNKKKPTGCPDCIRNQTSKVEDVLREQLLSDGVISNITLGQNASLPIAWRKNKKLRVDVLGSYKGKNIIFEYDGWYWHSDQPSGGGNSSFLRDLAKTQALLLNNCIVVRIREERYDVCLMKLGIKHENYIEVSYNYLKEQKFTDEFLESIYQKLEQMGV